MNRREVLRLLGGVAVVPMLSPFSAEARFELGRALHARLGAASTGPLDPHQQNTVALIAELILPESDTPGATSVKVPEFIALMLGEWFTAAERARFLTGLTDIDIRSRQRYGGVLLDLRAAEQHAMLTSLDAAEAAEGSAEDAFATLKELTIYGYFTSEVVMKQVLSHPTIPGRFDGCIPI